MEGLKKEKIIGIFIDKVFAAYILHAHKSVCLKEEKWVVLELWVVLEAFRERKN